MVTSFEAVVSDCHAGRCFHLKPALLGVPEWLQHHDALASGHNHAAYADHLLFLHRIADDGEGFLANLIFWCKVVGGVAITIVDSRLRHKPFDVDRAGALDGDFLELLVLNGHILILADRVPFDHVLVLDHVAGS
jgi:hypothetical protein